MATSSSASYSYSSLIVRPLHMIIILLVASTTSLSSSAGSSTASLTPPSSIEYKVGKMGFWRIPDADNPDVYNQWASLYRFRVGDSLYFQYKEDSVLVVEKHAYYHCNTTDPVLSFNDGKTVIKLDTPGPIYIISGAPDHCNHGQRFIIKVMGIRFILPSPPSIPNPPLPSPCPNSAVISMGVSPISVVAVLIIYGTLLWGAPMLHCLH